MVRTQRLCAERVGSLVKVVMRPQVQWEGVAHMLGYLQASVDTVGLQ